MRGGRQRHKHRDVEGRCLWPLPLTVTTPLRHGVLAVSLLGLHSLPTPHSACLPTTLGQNPLPAGLTEPLGHVAHPWLWLGGAFPGQWDMPHN